MHTIQLTLGEILLLKNEIYGSINPTNGEVLQKGLVNQNIPIKINVILMQNPNTRKRCFYSFILPNRDCSIAISNSSSISSNSSN